MAGLPFQTGVHCIDGCMVIEHGVKVILLAASTSYPLALAAWVFYRLCAYVFGLLQRGAAAL